MTRLVSSGAPDLAVEVISRNDRAAELGQKVRDYLAAGTQLVRLVDPGRRTATVHALNGEERTLGVGGEMNGGAGASGISRTGCGAVQLLSAGRACADVRPGGGIGADDGDGGSDDHVACTAESVRTAVRVQVMR